MISFNQYQYIQTLYQLGIEPKYVYPYEELIRSELNYINQFSNYLNEQDIHILAKVYETNGFELKPGEVSQEKLCNIYKALKNIHEKQQRLLELLYQPRPVLWQHTLVSIFKAYETYALLVQQLRLPKKVRQTFAQSAQTKHRYRLPELNSLRSLLMAPLQRLPHYAQLAKAIRNSIDQSERIKNHVAITFSQEMIAFEQRILELNNTLNCK